MIICCSPYMKHEQGSTHVSQKIKVMWTILSAHLFKHNFFYSANYIYKLLTVGCLRFFLFYSRTNSSFFMALMYMVTVTSP